MNTTVSKISLDLNAPDSLPEYIREDIRHEDLRVINSDNAFKALNDTVKLELLKEENSGNSINNDKSVNEVSEYTQGEKLNDLSDLWPGVHQDLHQLNKNTPSFFLTIGFMAGAFVSIVAVYIYSLFYPMTKPGLANKVVLSSNPVATQSASVTSSSSDVIVPITPVYEVQSGDSLAGIALKNYKRVSPRLIDEICKANGLTNANKIALGQKLTLPKYSLTLGKATN